MGTSRTSCELPADRTTFTEGSQYGLLVDPVLVGVIITGVCTIAGSGIAAFLGAKPTRHATDVVDARTETESRWRRIEEAAKLAVQKEEGAFTLGIDLLSSMAERWNEDPDQREHIKVALRAALKPEVEAFRAAGAPGVVTPGQTSPPSQGSGAP